MFRELLSSIARALALVVALVAPVLPAYADEPLAAQAAEMINRLRLAAPACVASPGAVGSGGTGAGVSSDAARAQAGRSRAPLRWNPQLSIAAERHARAMADRLFFDHVDPDGRGVAQRAAASGYRFRVVGENLAAGQDSLDEAMQDWLQSEGHCRNLLDERFVEFGIARVAGHRADDPYGVYWTLVLGRPSVLSRTAAID